MSLLNLISNNEFNSQGFANRQYVQLGSGLSMQVLKAVDLNNGWVELTLQRYNSIKQESQITTHKVKDDGSYLPNNAVCANDIISVATVNNQLVVTEKGQQHQTNINLSDVFAEKPQLLRIRNRNNHWFTVVDKFQDSNRGLFMLQLQQVGTDCKTKMRSYYNNGSEYSEDRRFEKVFSLNDIVEIQYA